MEVRMLDEMMTIIHMSSFKASTNAKLMASGMVKMTRQRAKTLAWLST